MGLIMTKTRPCKCECRWTVDFGDERGDRPVPAITAVMAMGAGLTVRLKDVSGSPVRPIIIPGLQYAGSREVVDEVCEVCGYPTKVSTISSRPGTHMEKT